MLGQINKPPYCATIRYVNSNCCTCETSFYGGTYAECLILLFRFIQSRLSEKDIIVGVSFASYDYRISGYFAFAYYKVGIPSSSDSEDNDDD